MQDEVDEREQGPRPKEGELELGRDRKLVDGFVLN